MCDETEHASLPDRDPLGRRIERVTENPCQELDADIRRMIQLSREAATRLGAPLRCRLTQQQMLVCEIKPDAMSGFDSWADSPCFFQNSAGVAFVPRGLPIEQESIRLYHVGFLPGQFRQFCERILQEEGFLPNVI